MRLGLVGCGRLAELGYLPAVERAAGVVLEAVADPDPGRRDRVASAAGVVGHADLHTLLAAHDVDAVVLASPADAHLDDARLATEAGVVVLVEKPPAPDVERAARLAGLGPTVHVGFNRRFDEGVRAVRDRIPGDGPVELELHAQYRRSSWAPHTVRDDVLADLGPHVVDLARWLTGSDVLAVTTRTLSDDAAELELRLDRGWARITCAADRYHAERVVVTGHDGRLVAEHCVGGPLAAVTGRATAVVARLRGEELVHPLVASLAAQLETLANRTHPTPRLAPETVTPLTDPDTRTAGGGADGDLGTGADGVAVMQVLEAARASADAHHRPVPVPPIPERQPC